MTLVRALPSVESNRKAVDQHQTDRNYLAGFVQHHVLGTALGENLLRARSTLISCDIR